MRPGTLTLKLTLEDGTPTLIRYLRLFGARNPQDLHPRVTVSHPSSGTTERSLKAEGFGVDSPAAGEWGEGKGQDGDPRYETRQTDVHGVLAKGRQMKTGLLSAASGGSLRLSKSHEGVSERNGNENAQGDVAEIKA